MPEVVYRDGRGPAERIQDRLRPSCPDYARRPQDRVAAQAETQTTPNRCVTTIYYGASQGQHGPGRPGEK